MKIAIYAEQCVRAGQVVGDRELEEHGEDCFDWHVYEDEPHELLEIASVKEERARPGGGGCYDRQVAATLRQAVYSAYPELAPPIED